MKKTTTIQWFLLDLKLIKMKFKMNRLKEVLRNKGIKQTWLADQMDKSYTTINEYARNKRQPSLEDIYKIAEVLNIDAAELLVKKNR